MRSQDLLYRGAILRVTPVCCQLPRYTVRREIIHSAASYLTSIGTIRKTNTDPVRFSHSASLQCFTSIRDAAKDLFDRETPANVDGLTSLVLDPLKRPDGCLYAGLVLHLLTDDFDVADEPAVLAWSYWQVQAVIAWLAARHAHASDHVVRRDQLVQPAFSEGILVPGRYARIREGGEAARRTYLLSPSSQISNLKSQIPPHHTSTANDQLIEEATRKV